MHHEERSKKQNKNKTKTKQKQNKQAILNARKRTPKNYPVSSSRPTCGDGC
jgi:hypothetical protein